MRVSVYFPLLVSSDVSSYPVSHLLVLNSGEAVYKAFVLIEICGISRKSSAHSAGTTIQCCAHVCICTYMGLCGWEVEEWDPLWMEGGV